MKQKFLFIVLILIFAVSAFGQSQRLFFAGHFLAPEHLEGDLRKAVRDNEAIEFTDTVRADLDMDGRIDEVTRKGGLSISFRRADSSFQVVELSKEDGKIAVSDVTGDGIPDILQNTGIGALQVYANTAMPAMAPQIILIKEDHALFFNYPNYSDSLKINYQPSVDDIHVGITTDDKGLLLTTAPDWHGKANLRVVYSMAAYRDTVDLSVLILPINDAPAFRPQPEELVLPEDGSLDIFESFLLGLASDPDSGDVLTLYPLGDRPELILTDSMYTYRPAADWYGDDSLEFVVSDGELADTLTLRLRVQPVDDAPRMTDFAAVEFPEDEYRQFPLSLLTDHASDVETPDSLLRFHVFSSEHIAISAEGGAITLMGDENWFGSESLMLVVSDGELADTAYWPVTITPVNDAPVLSVLPDTLFNEDETIYISKQQLEHFAFDVETPAADLKWQVKRFGKVRAFYNGWEIRCTASRNWYGTDSLELTVSDGELSASRIWRFHVMPVNDPPRFQKKKGGHSFLEDDTLHLRKRDLYKLVWDPETAPADLAWTLMPEEPIKFRETESEYSLYADPDWFGQVPLKIAINDGEYGDTVTVPLRVLSVNDKPVMKDPEPRTWNEDDTLSIDKSYLMSLARDKETSRRDLMWAFIDDENVKVRQRKDVITLVPAQDWFGEAEVGVIVYDGGLRDTGYMNITINPVNDAPRWKAQPDTSILEDGSLILPMPYVRQFVYDPDKDDEIKLDYKAGKNFYVEEKNDTIILWPLDDWYGVETIEFTASDGKKKVNETWKIPVISVNDAPYFTMGLPDSLSFKANSSDTLFFEDIVYDIDNDLNDLTWDITPGRNVRYLIDDNINKAKKDEDKKAGIIFFTENYKAGEDAVTIRVSDGADMIVFYLPVYVHEVDRFLMSNPSKLELLPNTPNPFKEYTDIRYSLPVAGNVSIKIYNLLGNEIKSLANGHHDAQNYSVRWWGETESGAPAPSGVYLCRMVAVVDGEPAVMMQKMMLVR